MDFKTKRYKPSFKSFAKLRENISGNSKLLKFQKKKWRPLVGRLLNTQKRRRYRRGNFHHLSHHITRNAKPLRLSFKTRMAAKKKLSLFYGDLTEKKLKNFFKVAFFDSKLKYKNQRKENILISNFETRLDTILFRSHFFRSFRQIRQFISHGNIFVKQRVVLFSHYKVQEGDVIEISNKAHNFVKSNVLNSNMFPFVPRYLQVDFATLTIVVVEKIDFFKIPFLFPFWLNVRTIFSHYQF